ncbi:phage terminase large subunit [Elongatibacter sediminis]|uniref:Phage terminase large subunit n=1 Tax=Elongatibacter sediminis TaxID=3119006 RepID=A0AAW9R789_9GAMM
MNLARDLSRALRPGWVMHDAGLDPDPWQTQLLVSEEPRHLLLCSRQSGKSTTVASKAVETAIFDPGLILMIAPAQRQSGELFRKAKDIYLALDDVPRIVQESARSMELANGSRIVALPGTEATIRGYSAPKLVLVDEAARVEDALYHSITPMLAVSRGRLIALTTPYGRRGWFYEAWEHGGDYWQRTKISAHDCPRIDAEWLKAERESVGDWAFRQEYLVEFVDTDEQFFSSALIEAAIDPDLEPIW